MSIEDAAQRTELQQWESLNTKRKYTQARYQPHEAGYGPEECEECGAAMPVQRREWGFKVCVTCKTLTEQMLQKRR